MKIIDHLNWRYATKRMNGTKVSQDKIDQIIEVIRLSPSSNGLQPFKLVVIENQELKQALKNVAYNQPQITEASHIIVFAALKTITPDYIDNYISHIAEERNQTLESLEEFKTGLMNFTKMDEQTAFAWASKQAYISLGTGLLAAAELKVDATPMEGFVNNDVDVLLGLDKTNYGSAAIMTLGYRDDKNDWLVNLKKVRKSKELLVDYRA